MFGYPEGATCDLPSEWRLYVLEARIRERLGVEVMGDVFSYEELPRELVGRVLEELVAVGGDFPVVLVNGHVACADGVDVDAVVRAFEASR